jgi:hypothetical protein
MQRINGDVAFIFHFRKDSLDETKRQRLSDFYTRILGTDALVFDKDCKIYAIRRNKNNNANNANDATNVTDATTQTENIMLKLHGPRDFLELFGVTIDDVKKINRAGVNFTSTLENVLQN